MNEQQLVCEVVDNGFQLAPAGDLKRNGKQKTSGAFRDWLEKHGNEGKTYVVISMDSPMISVEQETVKKLIYALDKKGQNKKQLKAVKKAGAGPGPLTGLGPGA